MTKFIFVTGGVVSSLGKGLAAASIGCLLEARGLRVTLQKLDPYINVDPGTMSPFQHGEVFVTDDGAETDLDLGHYERFIDRALSQANNVTIVEVGGTVGDIESLPFLEAIRQFRHEIGRENAVFVHLTLVPFISAAGEVKTKPTQHSVRELMEIGIQPDLLICRTERPLSEDVKRKIALFCNVDFGSVIESRDVPSIYQIPLVFFEQGLDERVAQRLQFGGRGPDLSTWRQLVLRITSPHERVRIAVVGKYTALVDSYKSVHEA